MKYLSVALYYRCVAIEENEVPKVSVFYYQCVAIEENEVPKCLHYTTSMLP